MRYRLGVSNSSTVRHAGRLLSAYDLQNDMYAVIRDSHKYAFPGTKSSNIPSLREYVS